MGTDYKVTFRTELDLANAASRLRRSARRTGTYTIDIVDLIERVLVPHFADKGGLRIEYFDRETDYDDPACVTFTPNRTLHVDRQIWAKAKQGFEDAYFVLAHEIAHILFHDYKAVAFSTSPESKQSPFMNEERSEWQADVFAKHLTMPDRVLQKIRDPDVISILCNVDRALAAERLLSFGRTGPMIKVTYEGDACPNCYNFTLERTGNLATCDTCGTEHKLC